MLTYSCGGKALSSVIPFLVDFDIVCFDESKTDCELAYITIIMQTLNTFKQAFEGGEIKIEIVFI